MYRFVFMYHEKQHCYCCVSGFHFCDTCIQMPHRLNMSKMVPELYIVATFLVINLQHCYIARRRNFLARFHVWLAVIFHYFFLSNEETETVLLHSPQLTLHKADKYFFTIYQNRIFLPDQFSNL